MAYLGRYSLPKTCFGWVLFGDAFAPEQALTAGLITQVCTPETLHAQARSLADRVLKLDPDGARNCKAFFQNAQENSLEQNFRLATETLVVSSLRLMDASIK
jgi:methylglutaconyl-CoA hydratase